MPLLALPHRRHRLHAGAVESLHTMSIVEPVVGLLANEWQQACATVKKHSAVARHSAVEIFCTFMVMLTQV